MGKKYFVLGRQEQPRQDKNLLYWHDKPSKPSKEGPLLFVLFESPLPSVSSVSRGHPSLVSVILPFIKLSNCKCKNNLNIHLFNYFNSTGRLNICSSLQLSSYQAIQLLQLYIPYTKSLLPLISSTKFFDSLTLSHFKFSFYCI